jgi:FtsZ-binding cell division protein ZapB
MNSASHKPATDRITRGRPLNYPVPERNSKKLLQKRSKMTIMVQEPIAILPEPKRAEDQQITNLNQKVVDLTAANKNMENSLTNLMKEFQTIRHTIELLNADNAVLKEENSKLCDNVRAIFNDMDYTMGKIQHLEQKSLSNNIEISGVPALDDEDLTTVLHRLFEHTDYQFTETTIKDAYRTKPNKKSGLPGTIIATFDCQTNKNCFMMKVKGKQLSSEFINSSHCRPVYIDDHLTKVNKYLFYLARCMRRKGDIKFVWIDNGKVLVKKSEGMESIVVECPKTLDRLRDLQIS